MKCEVCGRGPQDGTTVFRQNPKGEKGVWRCGDHNRKPVPREVLKVVEAFDPHG